MGREGKRREKQLAASANILKTCQSNLMKVSNAFRLLNVFGSFRYVVVVVVTRVVRVADAHAVRFGPTYVSRA